MADDNQPSIVTVIESPMVGFFHVGYGIDQPPCVRVGTVVHFGSTLCYIEAMNCFEEIQAGGTGVIMEILVTDGQPVEFGQPLFRVATTEPDAFAVFPAWDPFRDEFTRRVGG